MIRFLAAFLFITPFIIGQQNNSLSYPVSVPWNTPFELSLISSIKFPSAEVLEIIIESEQDIHISSIHFNTLFGSRKIDIIEDGISFRGEIDLKELQHYEEMNFQVLIAVKPNDNVKAGLEISGRYLSGGKELGLLAGPEELKASIEFYKPAKYAGKALLISGEESSFNIIADQEENFAADFWLKIKDDDLSVLKISNKDEVLFDIFINSFGMLSLQTHFQNIDLKPYFISRNVWYHITLFFNNKEDKSILYCNGQPVSINTTDALSFGRELDYSFSGVEQKEYIIDQLKFSRGNDLDVQRIISGRNFTVPSEYVETKKLFLFDTPDLNETAGIKVRSSNTKFIKSDAPLGLKTPDLNITIHTSYFDLEWNGGDVSHSQEFILEKSENNQPYLALCTFTAENDPDKKYSFTDKRSSSADIIYYRVKQVLRDGSVLYSSRVKVGQGFSEPFVLSRNFPNPFNPSTSIDIELFRDSDIRVIVYNLEGKEIASLFEGNLTKGKHTFSFDASEYPSGVYLCRVQTPDFSQTTKMILTK